MADEPYELIQEQTEGQSLGNDMTEGAVKEATAKIVTPQHEVESGLSRTVRENHDTAAWLVQHAAATIDWHRSAVDARTLFERRTGR